MSLAVESKDVLRDQVRQSLKRVPGTLDRARLLYFDRPSYALSGKHENEFDIKRAVAARYGIPFRSVVFAGSSQLGFSAVKDTSFEIGRSDLDVACIDAKLYMEFWQIVVSSTRSFQDEYKFSKPEHMVKMKDHILRRGMILLDFLPRCARRTAEMAFQDELRAQYRHIFGRVSIAVYMNESSFCWKQSQSINAVMG